MWKQLPTPTYRHPLPTFHNAANESAEGHHEEHATLASTQSTTVSLSYHRSAMAVTVEPCGLIRRPFSVLLRSSFFLFFSYIFLSTDFS